VARRCDVALCSDVGSESAVCASQSQLRFGVDFSRFFGVIVTELPQSEHRSLYIITDLGRQALASVPILQQH